MFQEILVKGFKKQKFYNNSCTLFLYYAFSFEFKVPLTYLWFKSDGNYFFNTSAIAAIVVEELVKRSPELYETFIKARNDRTALKPFYDLINIASEGLLFQLW
jgi:hypothetical protein